MEGYVHCWFVGPGKYNSGTSSTCSWGSGANGEELSEEGDIYEEKEFKVDDMDDLFEWGGAGEEFDAADDVSTLDEEIKEEDAYTEFLSPEVEGVEALFNSSMFDFFYEDGNGVGPTAAGDGFEW